VSIAVRFAPEAFATRIGQVIGLAKTARFSRTKSDDISRSDGAVMTVLAGWLPWTNLSVISEV
jgi:hypothetical protein